MKAIVSVLGIVLVFAITTSCSKEVCPGIVKSKYSFDKKIRSHYYTRKKPSPSLIHVSRATAKTTRGR